MNEVFPIPSVPPTRIKLEGENHRLPHLIYQNLILLR
jgi:hypothetical protein